MSQPSESGAHAGCPWFAALEDDGSWWCIGCGQRWDSPKRPLDVVLFRGKARQRRTSA